MALTPKTIVSPTQFVNGIHRILTDLQKDSDYVLNEDNTIKTWAINDPHICGVSCFSPSGAGHGLPRTKMWKNGQTGCFILGNVPDGLAFFYDEPMTLRGRNGTDMMSANHFLLIPIEEGLSEHQFTERVERTFAVPCQTRAAADLANFNSSSDDDDDDEQVLDPPTPWSNDDLNGVTDRQIVTLYRVARAAYGEAPYGIKVMLNVIMTAIAKTKPSVGDIYSRDLSELRLWCNVIVKCEDFINAGAMVYLTQAQDMLEMIIKHHDDLVYGSPQESKTSISDTDDKPCISSSTDTSPPGEDTNAGISSEVAIEYLRNAFIGRHHPIPSLGLLLNKMLFLADFTYVLVNNKRMFDEIPQAWANGPCYAKARLRFIHLIETKQRRRTEMNDEVKKYLDGIFLLHSNTAPDDLVKKIHDSELWKNILKNCNHLITSSDIIKSLSDPVMLALIEKKK